MAFTAPGRTLVEFVKELASREKLWWRAWRARFETRPRALLSMR